MADPLALLPVFTSGLAIQRLIEIVDALRAPVRRAEGMVMLVSVACAAIILGLGQGNMLILTKLGFAPKFGPLDYVVTTLVMSAGTEGVNSILKILGNTKDAMWGKVRALAGNGDSEIAKTRIRPL